MKYKMLADVHPSEPEEEEIDVLIREQRQRISELIDEYATSNEVTNKIGLKPSTTKVMSAIDELMKLHERKGYQRGQSVGFNDGLNGGYC